jgi:hypothetical protein
VVTVEEAVAFTDDVVAAADQQHRGQLLAAHKGGTGASPPSPSRA